MLPARHTLLALVFVAPSCHTADTAESTTTGISGFEPEDDSSTGVSTWVTSMTADPATSSTSDVVSDLPTETTTMGEPTSDPFTTGSGHDLSTDGVGCQGKLDILLVIDNGKDLDMDSQVPQIEAASETLLELIHTELAEFDLHILVTNASTAVWGLPDCIITCWDNQGQGCEPDGPADYPCDAYSPGVLDSCDTRFGAGETFPAGFGSVNHRCPTQGGARYITSADPGFDEAFLCLTDVGLTPGGELPMRAMQYAVTPELSTGCNEGFLRDDAVLLVITIDDTGSNAGKENAEIWTDALLDAKHGRCSSG